MSDVTRADLEQLSTEELRKRAFHHAEHHADVGFFWDLARHMPGSADLQNEDGSLGSVGYSLSEVIEIVRQLMGKDLGASEPLLRARFMEYLAAAE
ncbi:MAG: hypothetical protein ACJ735_16370 [Actinomycetes bacterium]